MINILSFNIIKMEENKINEGNNLDNLYEETNFEENRNEVLSGKEEETNLENNEKFIMKKMETIINSNKVELTDKNSLNNDDKRNSIKTVETNSHENLNLMNNDKNNQNSIDLIQNKHSDNVLILGNDECRKNSANTGSAGSDDVNFITEENLDSTKEKEILSKENVKNKEKTKMKSKNSVELEQSINLTFNVCLIGETCVGKTSLITSFCDNVFKNDTASTIGVDFRIMDVEYDDKKKCRLNIWDTAGQERFKSITYTYLKKAHGFMFVYDITNRKSFQNLDTWIQIVNNNSLDSKIISVLVGNKNDKEELREIETDFAKKFAEMNGMLFIETSAKNFNNVKVAFQTLTKELASEYANKIDYQYEIQKNNTSKRMSVGYLIDPKILIKQEKEKEDKCC